MKFSPLFDNAITDAIVQAAAFSLRFAAERHRNAAKGKMAFKPPRMGIKPKDGETPESIELHAEAERLELAAAYVVARARGPIDPASRVCAREEGDYDLGEILARALERQEKRRAGQDEPTLTVSINPVPDEPSPAALASGAKAIQQARGRYIDDFRPLAGQVWAAMRETMRQEFLQETLR